MIDRDSLPQTFEAEVTPEDIVLGKACEPCQCPLARAIGRALGIDPEGQVFVTQRRVEIIFDCLTVGRYDNPPEAKEFVRVYDRELSPPAPGKFVFHAGI